MDKVIVFGQRYRGILPTYPGTHALSIIYPSIYHLSIYLPIYLSSIYLSACLSFQITGCSEKNEIMVICLTLNSFPQTAALTEASNVFFSQPTFLHLEWKLLSHSFLSPALPQLSWEICLEVCGECRGLHYI